MNVLLTRPIEENNELAKNLLSNDIQPIISPLLKIELLTHIQPALKDKIIITTSINAIKALASITTDRSMSIVVVGNKSAEVAASFGFKEILPADNNASSLIRLVERTFIKEDKFIYLSGNVITKNISFELAIKGFNCIRHVIYNSVPLTELDKEAKHLLEHNNIDLVAFYSRRTAETFREIANGRHSLTDFSNCILLSLSEYIIEPLIEFKWKDVIVESSIDANCIAQHLTKLE